MAGFLALAGFQCYGDLVVNGDFATGDFTGWTLNGAFTGVAQSAAGYPAPPGDNYFVYFGSIGCDSYLSQTINTTPGAFYNFSFWVTGNGSGTSDLNAYWNGILVDTMGPVPSENWTEYTFNEEAVSSTTVIEFGLRNDPFWDGLGDISVEEGQAVVPEPSTVITGAFMLLPFGAGAVRQLRKKWRAP